MPSNGQPPRLERHQGGLHCPNTRLYRLLFSLPRLGDKLDGRLEALMQARSTIFSTGGGSANPYYACDTYGGKGKEAGDEIM